MKKQYIKPQFTQYAVAMDSILGNVSGESDGEWAKGTGSEGGGSSMWEYMEDEE